MMDGTHNVKLLLSNMYEDIKRNHIQQLNQR